MLLQLCNWLFQQKYTVMYDGDGAPCLYDSQNPSRGAQGMTSIVMRGYRVPNSPSLVTSEATAW